MTSFRIRRATPADAQAIAELHVRAWRAAYRGLVPDEVLDGLAVSEREWSWSELLAKADGSSFTLIAFADEGRVEGFCTATVLPRRDDAGTHTAEIAATYVDPDRWGAGIGSALLGSALEELRSDGYQEVTLWVFAANERACSFYRRFGFVPDGHEAKHDWSKGQLEVRLRSRLSG
jgi:GNAT superfamily N-acetyltransferase